MALVPEPSTEESLAAAQYSCPGRAGPVVDVFSVVLFAVPGRVLLAPLLWLSMVGERKNKTRA